MSQESHSGLNSGAEDELFSFDEALNFLDTSKTTLYKLLSQDEIRGVKVGKQWRFRKADLVAYLERGPVALTVDPAAHGELDTELAFFEAEIVALATEEEMSRTVLEVRSPETKIVALADHILEFALSSNCSDIHFEPMQSTTRLRFRIDGVLHTVRQMPSRLHDSLITRFKEMADMNPAEKRIPQDGRIRLHSSGKEYDIRVSMAPTPIGESAAMRILDRSAALQPLDQLGLSDEDLASLRSCINRPNGLTLAVGPAGSGKTLLIYSCLTELNSPGVKIATSEELVEYLIPGITQISTKPRLGLTLAAGLRSSLRLDPDVVMCSELLDQETAELALGAAMKGVGLLSTMFANDALKAIRRLSDMGIERYVIASALSAVVSTRLIRLLCPHCKESGDQEQIRSVVSHLTRLSTNGFKLPEEAVFFEPIGCDKCRGTGFLGRSGIFELLVCTPSLVGQLIQELFRGRDASDSHRIRHDHAVSGRPKMRSQRRNIGQRSSPSNRHPALALPGESGGVKLISARRLESTSEELAMQTATKNDKLE